MTPQRLPDWRVRLNALVIARLRHGFAWGERDCCLWAADAALAVTGEDPAAQFRGTYSDADGALALLRKLHGLRGVASIGGVPLANPLMSIEGDVALVRCNGKPMLGVHVGGIWLVQATMSLHAVGMSEAILAWGVGHA